METFYRVKNIVGSRQENIPALIPVSKSTWWAGVKSGKFPQPVKISSGITVWRESDLIRFMTGGH